VAANDTRRPVAVVAGGGLNGLGVVRALARGKVPTILVTDEPHDPVNTTRFATVRTVRVLAGRSFVDDMIRLGDELGHRFVLFLTQDKTVETADEFRDALLPHVLLSLPSRDCVETLMNKQVFQGFAERSGLPVPKTRLLSAGASEADCAGLTFPCILKPAMKNAAYFAQFKKAYVVQNPAETLEIFGKMHEIGLDAVLQEWIVGDEDSIHFYLGYFGADSEPVAGFSGRKILSWPPKYGGTACCIPAPEAEADIAPIARRVFKATGYRGMGSVEFKKDQRSGQFFIVEPTIGRTNFQSELATLNGVNLPLTQYCVEAGLALPPTVTPAAPLGWYDPGTIANLKARGFDTSPMTTYRLKKLSGYFRWNDPMPGVANAFEGPRERLAAISRRLSRLAGSTPQS
jgi:D-aspartate ligase